MTTTVRRAVLGATVCVIVVLAAGAGYLRLFVFSPGSQTVTVRFDSHDLQGRETGTACAAYLGHGEFTGYHGSFIEVMSYDTVAFSRTAGSHAETLDAPWGHDEVTVDCSIPVIVSPRELFILPGEDRTVTVRPQG